MPAFFRTSALHPDRAADGVDRDRRHALMQQVNRAYEKSDLLALLTLQLEIEQIDQGHLATVSETRLRHYNQILREQTQELKQELAQITQHLQSTMRGPGRVTRKAVVRDFECFLSEGRRELEKTRPQAVVMLDPVRRRRWLQAYDRDTREEARRERELDRLAMAGLGGLDVVFDGAFGGWGEPQAKPKRRSKRRSKGR